VIGDLWTFGPADARVITTNGFVKANGECVMGRGCAREARDRWPWLAKRIGDALRVHGNRCFTWPVGGFDLVTFPVKPAEVDGKPGWACEADLGLIEQSAHQLVEMADKFGWLFIVLPRPGAGNGRLAYEAVREVIQPILDERFYVITFASAA
jgi:hypothetical protein